MSWMALEDIALRLESASEDSPLAVFRESPTGRRFKGLYDAVFANTVIAKQRIEQDDSLIGVFSGPSQFTEKLEHNGSSDRR